MPPQTGCGRLRAVTIHVFTHSFLIFHPQGSTPCFGGFQIFAGNQLCVDTLHCVSLWGLCRPYHNMAKRPQSLQEPVCDVSWDMSVTPATGPGLLGCGWWRDLLVPLSWMCREGGFSMCSVPGGFYYGKAFLSSSRCPKGSRCPAVWGGVSRASYNRPAAAPSMVIGNRNGGDLPPGAASGASSSPTEGMAPAWALRAGVHSLGRA